ncbi:beta-ketoacyl synthase N-terminal-like domain-containing protein [Streptomyces lonegramiae]|uniref:Beta-ketoacyl synthase N-terminal-like domain-containing protein n=1 Tax=Streptomyces lonegramiae TaxID=3075524 RepID=A0ABU2XLF4_9ACTN|nr:beta-ketoacyl synthase N-terminal-like domain-containing protein [Streptomyces sp. DSM 41529]MDT0546755.1 beta-ketoacyl synthase N-terminal-like domain-containing protein [Streptomyces sp. DSM 41529]
MTQLVTGAGAVASVGEGVDEVFRALCAGTSGRGELRGFDRDRYRARHAYEIDDRPAEGGDIPGRATAWLLRAVAEAAAQAGLGDDLSGVPVLVGTGLRELRSAELAWCEGTPLDPDRLHFGPALRERFGAERSYTFSGACSASLYALALAADLLATGAEDTVVVAGVDTLTESMFGLLDRVHAEPPERVQPFDRARRGVLMGDGAAAVVLRREEPQRGEPQRGEPQREGVPRGEPPRAGAAGAPLGLLRAVSMNCDARHVTAPDPKGIAEAVTEAQWRAGVKPGEIDLVLLHGTGTLLNDEAEATAIAEVFGHDVGVPLMTAIKSMTGHTSGSSGLLSLIVALKSLSTGQVPPTLGLTEPVAEAAGFRFVRERVEGAELNVAQIDAFGFGGVNAVAIVERAEPSPGSPAGAGGRTGR